MCLTALALLFLHLLLVRLGRRIRGRAAKGRALRVRWCLDHFATGNQVHWLQSVPLEDEDIRVTADLDGTLVLELHVSRWVSRAQIKSVQSKQLLL
jgi:hypothetical protein